MLALLLVIVAGGLDVIIGLGKLRILTAEPPWTDADGKRPLVSIVVAARDEERGVQVAAQSLLAQRYPALEIVAVDDRSTDQTGAILDRLALTEPRLRVIPIVVLPPGWLGKNHALSVGAAAARGDWLLFTDADVVMEPDTVARAIGYAERRGVDHLTVMPELRMPGLFLQAAVSGFLVLLAAVLRPWKARDPRSRRSVGVGAFNLVRADVYRRVGGHEPIRLRPDDDLKLGKILKQSGARQDVVLGRGTVSVEWYHSVGGMIDGMMKNSFSVVEYQPLLMLGGILVYVVPALGPLAALLFGGAAMRLFGGLAVGCQLALYVWAAGQTRTPRRGALLYPLVNLLYAWIVLRALVLNLVQGGITWRGTFYSLRELRGNRV